MTSQTSKKRVALFGMDVLGEGPPGQGIPVLNDLFSRLSRDADFTFYSFARVSRESIPGSIQVRQVPGFPLPGRLKYVVLMLVFAFDHIRRPFDLLFSVSVYPPGYAAMIMAWIFRRPLLVQLIALEAVALPDINRGNLSNPWLRRITRRVCERATVLIAVADYQRKVARSSLPTTREIKVLPLRIDPGKFQFHERQISLPVRFVHIAHYSPVKDPDTLFKTFSQVSRTVDCHLTVIGAGFDAPKVWAMVSELGIRDKVRFTGVVRQAELPAYLLQAHLLLHTARFETGCAVIQEAMASGVAVCGTDVGILADLGEEYAVIAPPGDASQLAKKIVELVNDPVAYQKIVRKSFDWITTYDSVWAYKNYRALIMEQLWRPRWPGD